MGAKNSTEKMIKNIDNLFEEKVDSDKKFKLKTGKKEKKDKKEKKEDKNNEPKKCKLCGEK
jgi:hypothetical protein